MKTVLLNLLAAGLVAVPTVAQDTRPKPNPKGSYEIRKSDIDRNKRVVKGYDLANLRYDEIKDTLDTIKSKTGSISYVKASNRILVVDVPKVHRLVQDLLRQGAGPIVNVTIDVEFHNLQALTEKGIKLGWGYKDGTKGPAQWKLRTKDPKVVRRPTNVDIGIKHQKKVEAKYTKQSVTVSSGKAAQLWVTSEALDKAALEIYRLLPWRVVGDVVIEGFQPEIIKREVGSSLWVQPTYMKNGLVHIEVFPVVTYELMKGGVQSFRVEKVKTEVTVKPGTKFFIGGGDKNLRGFMKDVFGTDFTRTGSTDSLAIYVTPHVRIMNSPDSKTKTPELQDRKDMWRHFPD